MGTESSGVAGGSACPCPSPGWGTLDFVEKVVTEREIVTACNQSQEFLN